MFAKTLGAILSCIKLLIHMRAATRRGVPDKVLAAEQLAALKASLKDWGADRFCAFLFWILQKKVDDGAPGATGSRLVNFQFNRIQNHMYSRLAKNNRVLKARQAGFTTFFLLVRLLLNIITEEGKTGLLISQNHKYAAMHFHMARRAYRMIAAVDPRDDLQNDFSLSLKANILHTTYQNRRELYFDVLDSRLIVESAEVEEAGQGVTLHHVVASEVSRWPGNPEETMSNIKGAVVPEGTVDEECTANGAGGYYYERYLASMNDENAADARPHFYAWWATGEYDIPGTKTDDDSLLADLTEEEYSIILKMHKELSELAWTNNVAA